MKTEREEKEGKSHKNNKDKTSKKRKCDINMERVAAKKDKDVSSDTQVKAEPSTAADVRQAPEKVDDSCAQVNVPKEPSTSGMCVQSMAKQAAMVSDLVVDVDASSDEGANAAVAVPPVKEEVPSASTDGGNPQ